MLRKALWFLLVAMTAGCANSGVRNSADFATSLNSLAKREVLFNLRKVYEEGATFVPSHVVVSNGKSSTSFAVNPTFTIPLGPGFNNTIAGNNSFSGVTLFAAPSFQIGGNGTMSQDWSMTPASDVDALMRLRTLYLYVAGQMGVKAGDEEREFLCSYPVQRRPLASLDGAASGQQNIAYRVDCPKTGWQTFYADPSFVVLPNCIVCISSDASATGKKGGGEAVATEKYNFPGNVRVNKRLEHRIVYCLRPCSSFGIGEAPGDKELGRDVLIEQSQRELTPELPEIAPRTRIYLSNGKESQFRDFILFTYAAMAPATTAPPR